MKFTAILLLLITAFSCTVNKDEKGELLNVKEFYYPIDDIEGRIVYQYDLSVLVNGVRDESQKVIYMVLEKIDEDRISMTTYSEVFEVLDSSVVNRRLEGIELETLNINVDGNISVGKVDENLVYPWKRRRSEKVEVKMNSEMVLFEAQCTVSHTMTIGETEIGELDKPFNGEKKYAKFKIKTVDHLLNKEAGEEMKMVSIGYLIDLKGVGLYSSTSSNQYGEKRSKVLKKILTSQEWDALRSETKNQ